MKRNYFVDICPQCKKDWNRRKDSKSKRCKECSIHNIAKRTRGPIDISGQDFGYLTVTNHSYKKNGIYYWLCKCNCGKEVFVSGHKLRSYHTKSCGCLIKTRNGLSHTRFYRIWKAMIQRCEDPRVSHYERYGARGIKVCKRWYNFYDFYLDMHPTYKDDLTIDRIDNSKGYEFNNCRWVTVKEQNRNRKNNFIINAFGESKTLQEWSEQFGLGWSTLRKRIKDLGWNVEKALTQKVRNVIKKI